MRWAFLVETSDDMVGKVGECSGGGMVWSETVLMRSGRQVFGYERENKLFNDFSSRG